jgi:hypothetical protein
MPRSRKFALRSVDASRHLDIFLVCAVAAVLGNRTFLIITGYPQLGNGTLHISHAIWGALMMAIAIVIAIAFLPPFTRTFVAFLGGAGFGWFIDELGKFITRDVNYFFQPTIALIYIVFIAMYLVFRTIAARAFGPDEAVLNALEAVKAASIGKLDETRRREAVALLDVTEADGAIAAHVDALLRNVPALPPRQPGHWERRGERVRDWYRRLTERPGFARAVSIILVILAVASVLGVFELADDHAEIKGFSEWASVVSSSVAGVLIIVGAVRLHRSRVEGYVWFERGLLIHILVTQVFVFDQEQLAGISDLVVTIILWLMVRSALRAEREREVLAADPDVSAVRAPRNDSASPAPAPAS